MLNIKNLGTRVLTGLIFISVLMVGIFVGDYLFLAVFSLTVSLALYEFYGLVTHSGEIQLNKIYNTAGGLCLFVCSYIFFSTGCTSSFILIVPYLLYILILFISELYLKRVNPISSVAYSALGQIYIALSLTLLNYLAFRYYSFNGEYNYAYILALFLFIWTNDSFAYLAGSILGRHKLFERISPKKSWEGFIGGAIFTIIGAIIYSHFYPNLPLWGWIGFAIIVISAGTLGDLIESLFKRTLNVKDSGNLLPGHGGLLDRIDSVIFAIPALVVYFETIHYFFDL